MNLNFLRATAIFAAVFLFSLKSHAQREVLYEQYIQNPMAINPAFTGVREDFNMTVLLRRRWFTIPNSPITQTFAMDGTVADGKVGIGLQALNDRLSPYFTTGVYGSAAYHWDASVSWRVSLGMQGGINVLPLYDFASGVSTNGVLGSLGAGVYVRYAEQFYAGISKPELLSQNFGSGRQSLLTYRQPLFITAGAAFDAGEKMRVLPSVLIVQEKGLPLRVDVGTRAWYDEKVGFGAFYRMASVDYFQLSVEAQLGGNARLGYIFNSRAIESGIINSNNNNPLTIHELMLKFIPNPTKFHFN